MEINANIKLQQDEANFNLYNRESQETLPEPT